MDLEIIKSEHSLFFAVVNTNMGGKVLKKAREIGISRGTIFLGKGTVKNHLLELLGLYEVKKEIILMIAKSHLENQIHEELTQEFHLDKPNHGIVFSSSINKILGLKDSNIIDSQRKQGGTLDMDYEVIFTVVNNGFAEEVVDVAVKAGAQGGTIIHARGSNLEEQTMFFSISIDPEKEIVMILAEKDKSLDVMNSIKNIINIDDLNKGMIFSLDVNKTSGLYKEKK